MKTIDHKKSAECTKESLTNSALAAMCAHIQSMPESVQKKRFKAI